MAITGSQQAAPRPGRSAQREATRARLFEETVREFRERGFAATEVSVVTDRVGLSRGAFYVHFTGKDAVLRELLLLEERRIAEEVVRAAGPTLRELLSAVVDVVFASEDRLGRGLVRDLCAAQFRPEFVQLLTVEDHPLGTMLVEEIHRRAPGVEPVDTAMVFLTGLFGLLATDDASVAERRRRTDLLVTLVTPTESGDEGRH